MLRRERHNPSFPAQLLAVLVCLIGCSSDSGNSPVPAPNPLGDECGPLVQGWQHSCYGGYAVYRGPSPGGLVVQEMLNGVAMSWQEACCEGNATRATADDACQSGCAAELCAKVDAEYGLTESEWSSCLDGNIFSTCKSWPEEGCESFQVTCNFVSNEIFGPNDIIPLADLEKREWCGSSAGGGSGGETGGTSGLEVPPTWSAHVVDLDPAQTFVLVTWAATTWRGGSTGGGASGFADYRVDMCPTGGGDCVYLRRLVMYAGDIQVNGVEVSNLIAQLRTPVVLPYAAGAVVRIEPGALPMLLTYNAGGTPIAWETSNANRATGEIDPQMDLFTLDPLEYSSHEADINVGVELTVGGSHR